MAMAHQLQVAILQHHFNPLPDYKIFRLMAEQNFRCGLTAGESATPSPTLDPAPTPPPTSFPIAPATVPPTHRTHAPTPVPSSTPTEPPTHTPSFTPTEGPTGSSGRFTVFPGCQGRNNIEGLPNKLHNSNIHSCTALCNSLKQCDAFNWSDHNGHTWCWMKSYKGTQDLNCNSWASSHGYSMYVKN